MNKVEVQAARNEMQCFKDEIEDLTRKAVLLYSVLGKISNRMDEINQKAGGALNFDEMQKIFQSVFKAPS